MFHTSHLICVTIFKADHESTAEPRQHNILIKITEHIISACACPQYHLTCGDFHYNDFKQDSYSLMLTWVGDGGSTPRAIVTGTVTTDQIIHAGTGRSYAQGSGSWVPLDQNRTATNTAEHAGG